MRWPSVNLFLFFLFSPLFDGRQTRARSFFFFFPVMAGPGRFGREIVLNDAIRSFPSLALCVDEIFLSFWGDQGLFDLHKGSDVGLHLPPP